MKFTYIAMKHLTLLLLIINSFSVYSQDSLVETLPHFKTKEFNTKNPQRNLLSFIGKNLKYPDDERDQCIQGKIYLSFTVDTLGNIINLKSLYPNNISLVNEAKRVVQLTSGNWTSATKDGLKAPCNFTVPVNFTLRNAGCNERDDYFFTGVKYFEKQDYETSISAFKGALRLSPLDELAVYNLAASYLKIQQFDSACHYLDRPIESQNLEDLRDKFCK